MSTTFESVTHNWLAFKLWIAEEIQHLALIDVWEYIWRM